MNKVDTVKCSFHTSLELNSFRLIFFCKCMYKCKFCVCVCVFFVCVFVCVRVIAYLLYGF